MNSTQPKTFIHGTEEVEGTYVKRTGRFLVVFTTEWWEMVSSKHIGNDIHIKTDNHIRHIYLNGKKIEV
jgi:hypothetical protein